MTVLNLTGKLTISLTAHGEGAASNGYRVVEVVRGGYLVHFWSKSERCILRAAGVVRNDIKKASNGSLLNCGTEVY